MSPRSSVESPTRSGQPIHPVLQAALSSLDVQLDEELARYRRQRAGKATPPLRGMGRQQTQKPLDLIAVKAVGGRVAPKSAPSTPPKSAATTTPAANSATRKPVAQAAPPTTPPIATGVTAPAAVSASPTPVHPPTPEAAKVADESRLDTSSIVLTESVPEFTGSEPLAAVDSADPYDYLESSEELLRSLSEEEGQISYGDRGFLDNLFTPLGVGSLLLLLLSSGTLGYVMMNPAAQQQLGFNSLFKDGKTASSGSPDTAASPTDSAQKGLSNSPNLASKEFVDLNLNTLGTLKPNPNNLIPAPSPSPSPTSKTPSLATSTLTKPSPTAAAKPTATVKEPVATTIAPERVVTPQPVVSAPAPAVETEPEESPRRTVSLPPIPPKPVRAAAASAPRSAAPAPPAAASSPASHSESGSSRYVVTVTYTGDRALENVRKSVPDAYVRSSPDGSTQIQIGAFSSTDRAEEMAQKLQQQGISAKVQRRK